MQKPLFRLKFRRVPFGAVMMFVSRHSKDPIQISREIIFQVFKPPW